MTDQNDYSELPPSVDQGRLALATLAACFAKTFNEADPTFSARFEHHLRDAHSRFKDPEYLNLGVMETLKWTHQVMQWK